MNYNREQLYILVWTKTLNAAATDCGITAPVLRQICLTYDIPLPWGGYKPGKDRITLPDGDDFDLNSVITRALHSLQFSGETASSFLVPSKLTDPDPLIICAQNSIKDDFQFYSMPHMLRTGFGELAIRSSKSNLNRAMRIMDTLVKVWQNRGYRIVNQDKETTIYLREVSIKVGLRETTTISPSKERFGSQIYTATGQLAFKLSGWLDREWKDGKVPLENHIQEIIDHMEVTARDLEKTWVENKVRNRQRAEELQAESLRIKENVEEAAAFESLIIEAQYWQQLQTLDKYLDALALTVPRTSAFEQWLSWAQHRRRLFDPIEKRRML